MRSSKSLQNAGPCQARRFFPAWYAISEQRNEQFSFESGIVLLRFWFIFLEDVWSSQTPEKLDEDHARDYYGRHKAKGIEKPCHLSTCRLVGGNVDD